MEATRAPQQRKQKVPLLEPLKMLQRDQWRWWMFVLINLVGGTIGVWAGFIGVAISDEFSLDQQVQNTMAAGGLYTFAIAFVVSTAVSLRQSKTPEALERTARMKSTATILALIVVAIAAIASGIQSVLVSLGKTLTVRADAAQIVIVIIVCLVALYCALVSNYEEDCDDYAIQETANLRELEAKSKSVSDDGTGIKL